MNFDRRSFVKKALVGLSVIRPTNVLAESSAALLSNAQPVETNIDVDTSLHFLKRESTSLPDSPKGFYSTFFRVSFVLKEVDWSSERAIFLVRGNETTFSAKPESDRIIFRSLDSNYSFFWKPAFGFYILDPQDTKRILELCHPLDGKVPHKSNTSVTVPLNLEGKFYSKWIRSIFWGQGVPKSQLDGFEGFADESLHLDASNQRDEMIACGLNTFFGYSDFPVASAERVG